MKLSQGPVKICDWLLNSSQHHFSLHQAREKNRVTTEFEVPIRHILRPTLSTDMVQQVLQWGAQRGALVEKGKGSWQ